MDKEVVESKDGLHLNNHLRSEHGIIWRVTKGILLSHLCIADLRRSCSCHLYQHNQETEPSLTEAMIGSKGVISNKFSQSQVLNSIDLTDT